MSSRKYTKAELEREVDMLRAQRDLLLDELDACHAENEIIRNALNGTVKELPALVDIRTKERNRSKKQSDAASKSPYETIHEEARKFYDSGDYTTWGAAKKAVRLAEMNPGEFGQELPTVDAVNKALKRWIEEQK